MSQRKQVACSWQSPMLTGDTGWPRRPQSPKSIMLLHRAKKLSACPRHRPRLLGRVQHTHSKPTLIYTMYIKKCFILGIKTYATKLLFWDNYCFPESFFFKRQRRAGEREKILICVPLIYAFIGCFLYVP